MVRFALAAASLLLLAVGARAQTVNSQLQAKENAVLEIKAAIEAQFQLFSANATADAECRGYDTCATELPNDFCDVQFGGTSGCQCSGRRVSHSNPVIKLPYSAPAGAAKTLACYTEGIEDKFQDMYVDLLETGTVKWLYYADIAGGMLNYPGFLWEREAGDRQCDEDYDPRLRPWYVTASTGPKNVVLILDVSGSMAASNRIGLLKKAVSSVLDTLTHADYVGLVIFNDQASTYEGLSTLATAMPMFRQRLDKWVQGMNEGGGTDFVAGFETAFELVDRSSSKGYSNGCHTTYVFLTDGEAPSPASTIMQRKSSGTAAADEHYFIISLGSGTDTSMLKELACEIEGVFIPVEDNDEVSLKRAMTSYVSYFASQKMISKNEGVVWSERYISIPNIFGYVATAAVPVYDKSVEPWRMLGIAAADTTLCDIEAVVPAGEVDPEAPIQTVAQCTCLDEWKYQGKTYTACTTEDWSNEWCMTDGCGFLADNDGYYWDDCLPVGPAAVVDEFLKTKAKDWCEPFTVPGCALEALRGSQKCYSGCEDASEWESLLEIPSPFGSFEDWAHPGYGFSDSGPSSSGKYSPEVEECPVPPTMKPECAIAAAEEAELDAQGATPAPLVGLVIAAAAALVL